MDSKKLKKIFNDCMVSSGFKKIGGYYYQSSDEVICAIGLQKSSYSDGLYINVGYIIRQLNPNLDTPRDVDGDLRTRFTTVVDGKLVDLLTPCNIVDEMELTRIIFDNLTSLVTDYLSIDGLKNLIKKDPTLLYQLKIAAINFLGYVSAS